MMMLPLTALLLSLASPDPLSGASEKHLTFMCLGDGNSQDMFMISLSESGRWINLHRLGGGEWSDQDVVLLDTVEKTSTAVKDGLRVKHIEASGVSSALAGPSSGTRYAVTIDLTYPKPGIPVGINNPTIVRAGLTAKGLNVGGLCLSGNPSAGAF